MAIHSLPYTEYQSEEDLPKSWLSLLHASQEATKKSYAPYSKFHVGAAIRLSSGKVILGSNQENAAFPAGICAEQTALHTSGVLYPEGIIEAIAISACKHQTPKDFLPVSPCGGCRQVLSEFESRQSQPIEVLFSPKKGRYFTLFSASLLLPFGFAPSHL